MSDNDTTFFSSVARFLFGSIRGKIIVPYFLLTVVIAAGGVFIVTRIVAANVQDRLINQLIDISRATNESIVDWEQYQLDSLRLMVFASGVPEAVQTEDEFTLDRIMTVLATNQGLDVAFSINPDGDIVAGIKYQDAENTYQTGWLVGQNLSVLPMVQAVLNEQSDAFGDKFAGIVQIDDDIMLVTVAPVRDQNNVLVGAMAVGTPLRDIFLLTKQSVLADITMYQSDGQAIESTILLTGDESLSDLNITPDLYRAVLASVDEETAISEVTVGDREYQSAFSTLQVRGTTINVIGVSLPTTIFTTLVATNRTGLSIVFSVVTALVIVTGFYVAQNLTRPIQTLAQAAESVRAGNLTTSSGVRTADEIGVLGRTFDDMTLKLHQQTQELEVAYIAQEKEAAFLSAILSSVVNGIVVIAPSGEVVRLNPVAQKILLSDQQQWLDHLSRMVARIDDVGQKTAQDRVEVDSLWYEIVAAPVFSPAETGSVGVVISIRDVTDEVATERMRTSFIAQISHELRTPLTSISGFAQLAQHMADQTQTQLLGFLNDIYKSTQDLINIVNQILDVTQMAQGDFQLNLQDTDVNQVVEQAVADNQALIDEKGHQVVLNLDDNLVPVQGDDRRLQWALGELIKNACVYTLDGGHIHVTTLKTGQNIVIQVTDTGVGISGQDMSKIFEQFYRGFPTTPDGGLIDVRGAGLGLFILESVMKAHGGSIEVQTQVGSGTRFTLTLPRQPDIDANIQL